MKDYHDALALSRINSCHSCVDSPVPTPHLKLQPVPFHITEADVPSFEQKSLSFWSLGLTHSQLLTFLCNDFCPPSILYTIFSTQEAYTCSSTNYKLNPFLLPNSPHTAHSLGIVCAQCVDPGLCFLSPFRPSSPVALFGNKLGTCSLSQC